jgi:hypothetical protein
MDVASIEVCRKICVEAELRDALSPIIHDNKDVISFNLKLHHLTGAK